MHKAPDWQLRQRFIVCGAATFSALLGLSVLTGSITLAANAQSLLTSNPSAPTPTPTQPQGGPTGTAVPTPVPGPAPLPPATRTGGCADVYFIGAHGIGEGPDSSGHGKSPELVETAFYLVKAKPNKAVVNVKYLEYQSVDMAKVTRLVSSKQYAEAIGLFFVELSSAEREGVSKLDAQVQGILKACANPKIALVGYSLGAWVVDDWLSRGKHLEFIEAVELYGDPLWSRKSHHDTYEGIARREGITVKPDAYKLSPPGPGFGIAWQSLCLVDDPVCGEGYKPDLLGDVRQILDAIGCISSFCEHKKYAFVVSSRAGYGLTKLGGEFLASQLFGSHFPPASNKANVKVLGSPLP